MQHCMRDAAQDESGDALPGARTHHDQVYPHLFRLVENHRHRRSQDACATGGIPECPEFGSHSIHKVTGMPEGLRLQFFRYRVVNGPGRTGRREDRQQIDVHRLMEGLLPEESQRRLGVRLSFQRELDLFQVEERDLEDQFGAGREAQYTMGDASQQSFLQRSQSPGSHDNEVHMA